MNVAQIQLWSEPFAVRAYAAAVIAAALTVPLVAAALAARRGLPLGRVSVCLAVTAVTMLAGSRLLHWWTNPSVYQQDPARLLSLDFRDFSLYGGLLLAGLAGAACCAATQIPVWRLADCVAPALGVGILITRLGCFANGCCFGVETDLPWGVVYPQGSPAHLHQVAGDAMAMFGHCRPVHPTQVYEMLAAGVAALLAFALLRRNLPSGVPFLAAAVFFTGFRWINDPLRVNAPTLVTAGWSYRLLYAVLVMIGTAGLFWRLRERDRTLNVRKGSETWLRLGCVRTLNMRNLLQLAVIVAGILGQAERLLAAEIPGKVVEVAGDVVKIAVEGEDVPNAGDKVEIIFRIPGLDDVARIGSGKVTEVLPDHVVAKIDQRQGELAKGQQTRILSEHPGKKADLPGGGSPAGGSTGNVPGTTGAAGSGATSHGPPMTAPSPSGPATGAVTIVTNAIGMKLALIPAGSFLMGSPAGDGHANEQPQHRVQITRPFYLGLTPVTQGQYQKVMNGSPSWFSATGPGKSRVPATDTADYPVETVSHDDAVAFCRALERLEGLPADSYRLPTEAEWEYAARGGSSARFGPAEDGGLLPEFAWFADNSAGQPHPVGTKRANAFGLHDMQGNVWQWCSDWYSSDYYAQSPAQDPAGPPAPTAEGLRALRGGGWIAQASACRPADRNAAVPQERLNVYGFRVARTAPPGGGAP